MFCFYGFYTKLLRLLLKVTKVITGNQKWAKQHKKGFPIFVQQNLVGHVNKGYFVRQGIVIYELQESFF